MKTTAKSHVRSRMPISANAYRRFIDRIHSLLGMGDEAVVMVSALDGYLRGTAVGELGLDSHPALVLAFDFLRQEVDIAMERSRKARECAGRRRRASSAHTDAAMDAPAAVCDEPASAQTSAEVAAKTSDNSAGARQADREAVLSQEERARIIIETMSKLGVPKSILRKIALPSVLSSVKASGTLPQR